MELQVLEIKNEGSDCFSVVFKKPDNFFFYPGQFISISIKDAPVKPFTISASPTENYLMITTRKSESIFKQKFLSLKPGELITTTHPAGTFTLNEKDPAVFIAGGIGITPFRSIIKYAADMKLRTPVTLIYSSSTQPFVFSDELDNWQKQLPEMQIYYLNSRLTKEGLSKLYPNTFALNAIFYISGPPKMVEDIKNILVSFGTDAADIRIDSFSGY